ncbi:hypothetical protein [Engelhardtia mirabilis]|uniref:Uncharacterized protein n=1 Tax=Engelhardtia mirabilis TaxID=2528011 RepID=A0A518BJ26_9BACT|nr:hypothetical protein Pla133_20440 [Planctomycetes bacterium Pla133]QDV01296.1 hypothetical protein Pla86_20450 [Planctomycetes bacterium Pla86]
MIGATSGPAARAETDPHIAPPLADPPGRFFAVLVGVSALMAVFTAGFAVHYTQGYLRVRAGKDIDEQRATLLGVPFFKRTFLEFNERLARTLPRGSKVLVEPKPQITPDGRSIWQYTGQARWFLYLNHYAYPARVYVRQPELASGTLVDYPRWLDYHFLELEGEDGESLVARDEAAIDALGIEYRLRYPVTKRFLIDRVDLAQRVDGEWVPIELAPRIGSGPTQAELDAEAAAEALEDEGGGA